MFAAPFQEAPPPRACTGVGREPGPPRREVWYPSAWRAGTMGAGRDERSGVARGRSGIGRLVEGTPAWETGHDGRSGWWRPRRRLGRRPGDMVLDGDVPGMRC